MSGISLQSKAWRGICLYNILIQLLKDDPNPNVLKVANMDFQLTRSNAFSASRETIATISQVVNCRIFYEIN